MTQETLLKQLVEVCHELKAIALSSHIRDVQENIGTPEERAADKAVIENAQNILEQLEL